MRQRHIGGLTGRNRQRNADQPTSHGIQPVGFGINGDHAGVISARDESGELVSPGNAKIGVGIKRRHLSRQGAIGSCAVRFWCGRCVICRQSDTGFKIIDRPAITLGQSFGQRVELHRLGKTD